jgi:hypothetical protein
LAEFIATFHVAMWTNKERLWIVAYANTTILLTTMRICLGLRVVCLGLCVVFQYKESSASYPDAHMSRTNTSTIAIRTYSLTIVCPRIQ